MTSVANDAATTGHRLERGLHRLGWVHMQYSASCVCGWEATATDDPHGVDRAAATHATDVGIPYDVLPELSAEQAQSLGRALGRLVFSAWRADQQSSEAES